MVDTKKLISGFLILASIMSSLAFVFSGEPLNPTPQKPTAGAYIDDGYAIETEQAPALPANAFAETALQEMPTTRIASVDSPLIIKDDNLPPPKPTSNLTEAFAQYLSRNLMAANPNGPQEDENGEMNFTAPPIDDLAAAMAQVPQIKNFKIPDWDAEAAAAQLAIINNPSEKDREKYAESLGALFNKYLSQPDFVSIFYKDPTATDISELQLAKTVTESAAEETKSLPTPANFADFHKAMLAAFVYEKNAIALATNASEDPIKASLVMNAKKGNVAAVASNFENQLEKSGLRQVLSSNPKTKAGVMALLNNLVGIKTAHAQWAVSINIGHQIQDMFEWLDKKIGEVLTEVLKNTIFMTMQNDILNWARSGFRGAPAFITNWKQFLENVAFTAIGAVISDIKPELCSGLRPQIEVAMGNPRTIAGSRIYGSGYADLRCSLNLIRDIRGFYNDFSRGGWRAYSTVFRMQNNYFGSIIHVRDSILRKNAEAQSRASNQAQAGKGFKSKFICDDGYTQVDEAGTCKSNTPGVPEPVKQGRIATPGDAVGNIVNFSGTGAGTQFFVNKQNFYGLLATIAMSMIRRVVQSGF